MHVFVQRALWLEGLTLVYAVFLASYVRKRKQDRSVAGIDIDTFMEKLIDKAHPLSWEHKCSVLHTASDGNYYILQDTCKYNSAAFGSGKEISHLILSRQVFEGNIGQY